MSRTRERAIFRAKKWKATVELYGELTALIILANETPTAFFAPCMKGQSGASSCRLCVVIRTVYASFVVALAFCGSASANWFNKSEEYLAACQKEAVQRFYKDASSHDVRRHIYLCMIAHGYAFKASCGQEGWAMPDCYRLKWKTEGR
jgi:hypothetical protein